MKQKKKPLIIGGVVLVAIIAGALALKGFLGSDSTGDNKGEDAVYVDSVAMLTGMGSGNGMIGRFSGVVEPQQTVKVSAATDRKIAEVYVKEGDEVKVGDKLFSYDLNEAQENLAQAEIDVERIGYEIENYQAQADEYEKEKKNASKEEQLNYTMQINTALTSKKRSEYELKSKKVEVEQLKKLMENVDVVSEIDGIVKSLKSQESQDDMYYGYGGGEEEDAFITLMATGTYRVKGLVNEQNTASIMEGAPVIIRSRVDETVTWKGTMGSIDFEKPQGNQSDMYYGGMGNDSSTTNSNNYPFYVELDSIEGLMLGQHVFIEMDNGQEEAREGMWLDGYYIVQEDDEAYVWASGKKDKIEKREITLGEYDEVLDQYEILEGLTADDYIAYPMDTIEEGQPAVKNTSGVPGAMDMGMDGDMGMDEDMGMDGDMGMDEDMYMDGEMDIDEGVYMEEGEGDMTPAGDAIEGSIGGDVEDIPMPMDEEGAPTPEDGLDGSEGEIQ